MEFKFKTLVIINLVLTGILARNLFSNPYLVSHAFRTQATFMSWFCDFVAKAQSDTMIYANPDYKPTQDQMNSRAQIVQSNVVLIVL